MVRYLFACLITLCCVAWLSLLADAQTPTTKTSAQVEGPFTANAAIAHSETASPIRGQRAIAISLITSLADEAQNYQDQILRARVQARAADALWDIDKERSRALFLRAWEVAEGVDQEDAVRAEAAQKKFLSTGKGVGMLPPPGNLRGEVLKLATQHERALGEELLRRLDAKDQTDSDLKNDNTSKFLDPSEPKLAIAKRLEVARQLLDGGDVSRAILFADPALQYATSPGIIFLSALRQKNAEAADKRYASLLAQAAIGSSADATTISLLSSYIFTPSLLVTATRRGRVSNQWTEPTPPPDISPDLRATFFRVAAQVLLHPLPSVDQDRTSAGRAGTYFTITRLLPLFEQYAANQVTFLRTQLAALASDAPESFRSGEDSMLTLGLTPKSTSKDEVQEALEQLAQASSADQRDSLYVKAARAAALTNDQRAREFADKIEDDNMRKRTRAFVDFLALRSLIEHKEIEQALPLVKSIYLSHIQRVWAYTETALGLKKADPARAMQLLNEAASEASRIDGSEPEHVQALVGIASRFFEIDPARAWEMMAEAVKAANNVVDFTGEDGKVSARLQTSSIVAMVNTDVPAFNLAGVFGLLAREDLYRAVSLAKSLKGESARATATIAIAQSVLDDKLKDPTH